MEVWPGEKNKDYLYTKFGLRGKMSVELISKNEVINILLLHGGVAKCCCVQQAKEIKSMYSRNNFFEIYIKSIVRF